MRKGIKWEKKEKKEKKKSGKNRKKKGLRVGERRREGGP